MTIDLMDATHYAKLVGRTVAICLLDADGDSDAALATLAEMEVGDHEDPIVSDMTRSLVEQAIREAVEVMA